MKIGNMEILLGSDPELFVSDGTEFVSAHKMVEGTKEKPQPVMNGAVQVDGMALEFNIDPAANKQEFIDNLQSVMGQLADMVPNYQLHAVPTAEFSGDILAASPAEALELGCDPDFNAWEDGRQNPKPNAENTFRTAAGHIHVGWTSNANLTDPAHIASCIAIAKQLDLYLGVPSLLYDNDSKRREMYGQAGAFRIKPYGMEYRVLSNAWLQTPELMGWVYDNTIKALSNLMGGGECPPEVRDVINTSDVNAARDLCAFNGISLPQGVY